MKEARQNEPNQTTIIINPLSPFIDKYGIEIELPREIPHSIKAIIALAIVAGISHSLMAWASATWISYVSFDTLLIGLTLLLIWDERKRNHDFKEEQESST